MRYRYIPWTPEVRPMLPDEYLASSELRGTTIGLQFDRTQRRSDGGDIVAINPEVVVYPIIYKEKTMNEQERKIHEEQLTNVMHNWFIHHPPKGDIQVRQYQRVRDAAQEFAMVIMNECPVGADRTAALRMCRETMMAANTAIACNS